jgi:4-hydroxybenzoate polyprenyltransferase
MNAAADTTIRARLYAWLQLLRPPNIFTVPGDVLVGWTAAAVATETHAHAAALAWAIAGSALLYLAGLVLNDWFDRGLDAVERPARPIPSGRVRPATVCAAGWLTLAAGLGCSAAAGTVAFLTAAALAAAVIIYNGAAKRVAAAGVTVMGFCRGLNVCLGAAACAGDAAAFQAVALPALVIALYIVVVAAIAVNETVRLPARPLIALIAATPIVALPVASPATAADWCAWVTCAVAAAIAARALWKLTEVAHTSRHVGRLIRNLILLQGLFVTAAGGGWLAAAGAVVAYGAATVTGRWFYGS